MGQAITLGALARREAALLSCLAAAAAAVGLAGPLHTHWLYVAGVAAAGAGALARLVIRLRQAQIEAARERVGFDRRTRVSIMEVTRVDPTEIGVDAAAQTILGGNEVPSYLPRQADEQLRAAVRSALSGTGRWIVVAVGRSKVGKSRALFEAVRHCASEASIELVAPVDGDALRSLMTPGEAPRIANGRRVLWLDDLEPFLNQGVTFQTLREWHASAGESVIVATYGGKGSDLVMGVGPGALATVAGEVLQHAREVPIPVTTTWELEPLRSGLAPAVWTSIGQHGLAAYLVAAPELERKLSTEVHAIGEPRCPEGAAIVYAAIDWDLCGRTDPVTRGTLRELWPSYLPAGARVTDADFERGLDWALRPVAGTIALLQGTEDFRPYDYVVRFVDDQSATPPPSEATWRSVLRDASGAQALAVGENAHDRGFLDASVEAFRAASRSPADVPAMFGSFNLAISLGDLGRLEEALAVYGEMLARFGDAPEHGLRRHMAGALVNKAATLVDLGRREEALAAFEEMLERFGDAPEPELCEPVARALVNKGITMGDLGRADDELAAYAEVLELFADAPELVLRDQVARALVNRAAALIDVGRSDRALAAYDEVLERFGGASELELRYSVARALVSKSTTLVDLGSCDEAVAVCEEVLVRFGDAPQLILREQVASALVNQAAALVELNRCDEALAAYDEVLARLGDASELILREQVFLALACKSFTLRALGRSEEAIEVLRGTVMWIGDASEPSLIEAAVAASKALAILSAD
jgi:tetratricopeptide (TPR) repeat protein